MSRATFFIGIFVLTAVLGCDTQSPVPGPIVKSPLSGTAAEDPLESSEMQSRTMLLKDDSTLRYSVYLPEGFDKTKPTPLIFALHYGGPVSPFYGGGMIKILIEPGLKDLNAIIVAPDSIDGPWGSERNRAAVEQLLDQLRLDYSIDEEKTLLTGFSMGGNGTWVIAAEFGEQFKAAIPIAGRGLQDSVAGAMKSLMPFYVIHSTADTVVPIGPTREFVKRAKEAGADITWVEVPDLSHFRTYEFAKPLADAVPWVRKIWKLDKD